MGRPGRYYGFGYLLALAPPLVFVAGQWLQVPGLLFFVLFGIAPLSKPIFGTIPLGQPQWSESVAACLHQIPTITAMSYALAAVATVVGLQSEWRPSTSLSWLLYGFSLWSCMLCAVPVAHDLLHRRGFARFAGAIVSGLIGYPVLEGEHMRHHSMSGTVDLPEWPRVTDSVWAYARRRAAHVFQSAFRFHQHNAKLSRMSMVRFVAACSVSATVGAAFYKAAGALGLAVYGFAALGVHFTVHGINYVQHWGLGSDNLAGAQEGRFGWECCCRVQGWLLLNIALHHSHHQRSSTPYYRLAPHSVSPKLPVSYLPSLVISMFPPLWRRLMLPQLAHWQSAPQHQQATGARRILCLPIYFHDKQLVKTGLASRRAGDQRLGDGRDV